MDRLHRVEVMEHAAERNIEEREPSPALPTATRVLKIRKRCRHIEKEAAELKHEFEFMEMGPVTTLDALVDSVDKVVENAGSLIHELREKTRKKAS